MASRHSERKNGYICETADGAAVITIILKFLTLFMPITLAKRVVSMILIAAGVPVAHISELTTLTKQTIRTYGKCIRNGEVDSLLHLKVGGSRGKAADVETEIVAELEKGNYHTRQQIADMIKEKFHISMSVSAVGKLLKKTVYGS